MKILFAAAGALAIFGLALPGALAAPPRNEVAELKRQVAALQAKVKRLRLVNQRLAGSRKALAADNKLISARWNESLRRELRVTRYAAAVSPCPITRPNQSPPPGRTFGADFHGNGAIWVGVPDSNVVVWNSERDGSVRMKFGWWREVEGKLVIEGRRLDGTGPPLRADVPEGYGERGFQPSGIVFPTEGCWEVTGRAGASSLTFVTLVLAA